MRKRAGLQVTADEEHTVDYQCFNRECERYGLPTAVLIDEKSGKPVRASRSGPQRFPDGAEPLKMIDVPQERSSDTALACYECGQALSPGVKSAP